VRVCFRPRCQQIIVIPQLAPTQACAPLSFRPAACAGDGQRNGRKAILKPLQGRHIAGWYFSLTGPKLPMIVDDVEEE
jgi:hypothetical protein